MRDGGAPGRGRPGDALAAGQGRLAAQPQGAPTAEDGRRVNERRDRPGSTSRRSSAAIRWATWSRRPASNCAAGAGCDRASAPSTRRRGQLHRLRRHAEVVLLRLRPGRRRARLHPAHGRGRPARGDPPAGVVAREAGGDGLRIPEASVAPSPQPDRDPALLTAAMRCYRRQLELSDDAQGYLASRGIDAEAARRLGLGYASGRGLRDWLVQAGFDDRRILASGLASDGRERFRGMIVVPELAAGRVHWLAGRAVWREVRPRFQALPAPSPCSDALSAARIRALGRGRRGPVRLAPARRLGPARRGGARHPGDGQAGFLPTGNPARPHRLRRRPGRLGCRPPAQRTARPAPRPRCDAARWRRRCRRTGRSPGWPLHLQRHASASGCRGP